MSRDRIREIRLAAMAREKAKADAEQAYWNSPQARIDAERDRALLRELMADVNRLFPRREK